MPGVYSNKPLGKTTRTDRAPGNAGLYANNRKIILASQSICAICGQPVDKTLKAPHPMSATVDHIIPVSKHGDPTSLDNLQLTHRHCNLRKGNKITDPRPTPTDPNRILPLTYDWRNF